MLFATRFFPAVAWAVVTSSGGVSGHADRSCAATSVTPRTTSGSYASTIAAARRRLSSARARWKVHRPAARG